MTSANNAAKRRKPGDSNKNTKAIPGSWYEFCTDILIVTTIYMLLFNLVDKLTVALLTSWLMTVFQLMFVFFFVGTLKPVPTDSTHSTGTSGYKSLA